jgi:hypothetical protein
VEPRKGAPGRLARTEIAAGARVRVYAVLLAGSRSTSPLPNFSRYRNLLKMESFERVRLIHASRATSWAGHVAERARTERKEKPHVAALLKVYPTMTIREADAFYKLVCRNDLSREDSRRAASGGAAEVRANFDQAIAEQERGRHHDVPIHLARVSVDDAASRALSHLARRGSIAAPTDFLTLLWQIRLTGR